MKQNEYHHVPVLLSEVISILNPKPGENFVDATFGGGGYTRALLENNQPGGKVLAIDLDQDALQNSKFNIEYPSALIPVHGNFRDIDTIVEHHKFIDIRGIVADIGLSSFQIDQSGRGISFQKKEILDMRFDQRGDSPDARFLLNNRTQAELASLFKEYGEEPFSNFIAKGIVNERNKNPIKYTTDLYDIIQQAIPRRIAHKANDAARRIFQALRIAVNHELSNLEEFLPKAFDVLAPGGVLVVVSFHSLEDRMVKQFFAALTKGCVCPPDFPQCLCGKEPQGALITRKPVTAQPSELEINSRSKPAKLRAIKKL